LLGQIAGSEREWLTYAKWDRPSRGVEPPLGDLAALTKGEPPGRMKMPHLMKPRRGRGFLLRARARVAELADALRSGRSDRKVVEVRVLSRAPSFPLT
jgi:hypothetical protein